LKPLCLIAGLVALACAISPASAQRLSPLAATPVWDELDAFHGTITRAKFVKLLETIYAPGDAARGLITVGAAEAVIRTSLQPPAEWRLRFASDAAGAKAPPRYWRPAAALGPATAQQPLAGMKIALDPGHLGGDWAKMEERWFQVGDSKPVEEGELTLLVSEKLAPQLRALGAEVVFVRDHLGPTTPERPANLEAAARAELALEGVVNPVGTYDASKTVDPGRGQTVQWQSERLFYRISEIRHRAEIVNQQIKPDLVICLHFNAEDWGKDPRHPHFVPVNHLHAIVNGCYGSGELRFDDQRHDLLVKLLNRSYDEELAVSQDVVAAMAEATKLPPYRYTGPAAKRVGDSPYVWARNLLANRLYQAPVVFLEPFVMNNAEIWTRVQAGDYEGERLVAGTMRKSLYREYADAVAAGLAAHYAKARAAR
jgi:N-acetylmuramoyl-L-alanine amidase